VPTGVTDTDQVRTLVEAQIIQTHRYPRGLRRRGDAKPFSSNPAIWRRHIDLNLVSMLAASCKLPVAVAADAALHYQRQQHRNLAYRLTSPSMQRARRHQLHARGIGLADHLIRVNAIAPTAVTPGCEQFDWTIDLRLGQPTPEQDAATATHPLRAGIDPECGPATVFLSSRAEVRCRHRDPGRRQVMGLERLATQQSGQMDLTGDISF
jgi:hypothetical protein